MLAVFLCAVLLTGAWCQKSSDSCSYTFSIPGSQLTTKCGSAELENAIKAVENKYVRLQDSNKKLQKEVAKLKASNQKMEKTLKAMKKQTDTWSTAINLPKVMPRLKPDGIDPTGDIIPKPIATDCQDAKNQGYNKPGVYSLQPANTPNVMQAYCDNGWLVIQRRYDGSVNFQRKWTDYLKGFGDLSAEYWLGLEHIYHLTSGNTAFQLRIEGQGWTNKWYNAEYESFEVGDEASRYKLKLGKLTSTNYKDGFSSQNGMDFTTMDKDNDIWHLGNCAEYYHGGWWLDNCGMDLNRKRCDGPGCMTFADVLVKKSIMKIRPTGPKPAVPTSEPEPAV